MKDPIRSFDIGVAVLTAQYAAIGLTDRDVAVDYLAALTGKRLDLGNGGYLIADAMTREPVVSGIRHMQQQGGALP